MKFDTIIIGGGLSGLITGIALAEKGQNCAIVSAGQSTLHFNSGSFDLIARSNDSDAESPAAALRKTAPAEHPYAVMGIENVVRIAGQVPQLLKRAEITVKGSVEHYHYRVSPMGILKPTWLSMDEFSALPSNKLPWNTISIQNINGFLDFHTAFIANNLTKIGAKCTLKEFTLPQLDRLRANHTEMRATNIAKLMETPDIVRAAAQAIVANLAGEQVVALPAVFGIESEKPARLLRQEINDAAGIDVWFIPVVPPSVAGIRVQNNLCRRFRQLGGTFLLGDTVIAAAVEGGRVISVETANLPETPLYATNFVLATGSFVSHGLEATPNAIVEPIFGLDVTAPLDRNKWYNADLFDNQPFMSFGIATDQQLRPSIGGSVVSNLRVAGACLASFNPIKDACGAGVSIISALHAAEQITRQTIC